MMGADVRAHADVEGRARPAQCANAPTIHGMSKAHLFLGINLCHSQRS